VTVTSPVTVSCCFFNNYQHYQYMLSLLIKTRLKYYRNYIRYHFDRRTKIEIAIIFLLLLLLLARSPADIGYNFRWISDENFPQQWASFFVIYLLIFYLLAEAFAYYTLRHSKEWQLLGSLPFSKKSVTNYYLVRHLSKTILFIFIGCLPFLLSFTSSVGIRTVRFFAAIGALIFLQLLAFNQAFRLRNPDQSFLQKNIRWLLIEVLISGFIILNAHWLKTIFSEDINPGLLVLFLIWMILPIFLKYIYKSFVLREIEGKTFQRRKPLTSNEAFSAIKLRRGFYPSFIMHDILFLWRQKRSSFLISVLGSIIAIAVCLAENEPKAVYVSLLFIEAFFSLLLINTLMILFNKDVEAFGLIRSLPIPAASFWLSRWLITSAIISIPVLVPIVIILIKYGVSSALFLFSFVALFAIPGILATVFCNSAFGMFPHINLAGYIIVVSVILMVLFWFFMPFGSLIILGVMVFWIRRSQRHFQYLEI